MKMEFLFSGLFWGLLLILIGLIVVINVVFKIEIPVGRIIFGLLFVYIGLHILFGGGKKKENVEVFAGGNEWTSALHEKYDIVFGQKNIDLSTNINLAQGGMNIKIDTVFGESKLKIDPNMPVKIIATAVFGSVKFPNGTQAVFGDQIYTTASYKEGANSLLIKMDTIFGSTEVYADTPVKHEE
ncbi:MAG: hypothetical protein HPY53_04915 [Brevinematales bacterium]|nr:hypothetical protein [Brevinematales bacterium]